MNERVFFVSLREKLFTQLHKIFIKQHLRLRGGQPVAVRYFIILTSQQSTCRKEVSFQYLLSN